MNFLSGNNIRNENDGGKEKAWPSRGGSSHKRRRSFMNKKDPKLTALQFNQCINDQNIHALSNLMTENHVCIIGEEEARIGKEIMTKVQQKIEIY